MTRDDVPESARAAAASLAQLPGVLGVFLGSARRGGEWQDKEALVVHVRRKLRAPIAPVPRSISGHPTDVIAVGDVLLHSLVDTADIARTTEPTARSSAISAIGENQDGRIIALLSGHGTLPRVAGGFAVGPWSIEDAPWLHVVDDHTTLQSAELRHGEVSPTVDFALALLPNLSKRDVLLGHTFAPAPLRLRKRPLLPDETLYHWSPVRSRVVSGRYAHGDAALDGDGVPASGNGASVRLKDVIVVRPMAGEPVFSVSGDSGSLVVDEQRRAVGFVVAGTESGDLSYVRVVNAKLRDRLQSEFGNFFEDP